MSVLPACRVFRPLMNFIWNPHAGKPWIAGHAGRVCFRTFGACLCRLASQLQGVATSVYIT